MLKAIKEIPIIQKRKPFEIQLSNDVRNKIKKNWTIFIKDKDNYWDGEILAVTNFNLKANMIEIGKAKYSWLVYSRNNNDLEIGSLFVSILFKTLDNDYVIIKNNHNEINLIGGIVEENDLAGDKFNPNICLRRELKEELNLDLYNVDHVKSYKMQYLKLPNPGKNYGIVYTGILNFHTIDLMTYFEEYKDSFDHEIDELLLLKKEEVKSLKLNDCDISYLMELMDFE